MIYFPSISPEKATETKSTRRSRRGTYYVEQPVPVPEPLYGDIHDENDSLLDVADGLDCTEETLSHADKSPRDMSLEEVSPEDGSPEDGSPEDGSPEDVSPEEGSPEDKCYIEQPQPKPCEQLETTGV